MYFYKIQYLILCLFFAGIFTFSTSAQTTVYKETVGSSSGTVNATSYNGWMATNRSNVAAVGTVVVTNGIIPSNYSNASGGTPIQINGNSSLIISGINTSGYANIKLNFGIHKTNKNHTGSDLLIQASVDGVTFTNLNMALLPTGNGTGNAWVYRTGGTDVTGYIPPATNLHLKFTTTSGNSYSLDDLELQADVALPLRLIEFKAQRTSNTTKISWTTEDEVNVDHFEVQRGDDINSFKTIQTVSARNSGNKEKYFVTDYIQTEGKAYYRLYSVDKDGKSSYSKVSMINSGPSESISVSVNTASAELLIDHKGNNNLYQYCFVNINGQVIQNGQISLNPGLNRIPLKKNITKGIYVVQVISATTSLQVKTNVF